MKDSPARRLGIDFTSAAPPLEVVAGARRHRVLIVDDEAPVRSVLRRYLDRRGWEVIEAESGEQALAFVDDESVRIDAAIVDVHMAGLGGTALCQRIAAARPALLTKMIVATGDAPGAADALARAELNCPVLSKPFELSELERALRALIV